LKNGHLGDQSHASMAKPIFSKWTHGKYRAKKENRIRTNLTGGWGGTKQRGRKKNAGGGPGTKTEGSLER